MTNIQVTIKNMDGDTFSELKAEAAKRKLSVSGALSLAIHSWLSQMRKPRMSLLDWKTIKGGKGTERLSEQVDEILYGE